MVYWDADGWASWLSDGARLARSADRGERASAFAPLTRHPDLDGPRELLNELKVSVPDATLMRMEDGLAQCIAGWSWDDGVGSARFLIELAGHVEGPTARMALKSMLLKPHNFAALKDSDKLADSIASVLSKRSTSATIRELLPQLEPLLAKSPSAAILVAARLAHDDPQSFVAQLHHLAPNVFAFAPEHPLWRFATNKLIELAGVAGAVKAAFANREIYAETLRKALAYHRLDLPCEWPGQVVTFVVMDRIRNERCRIPEFDAKPPVPIERSRDKKWSNYIKLSTKKIEATFRKIRECELGIDLAELNIPVSYDQDEQHPDDLCLGAWTNG